MMFKFLRVFFFSLLLFAWVATVSADDYYYIDSTLIKWWFGSDEIYNPNLISTVSTQSDGKIIIGWIFNYYNNTQQNSLIRLNSDSSVDATFNIWLWFVGMTSYHVVTSTKIQSDGKIIVWWAFTWFNGGWQNRIVRLNADWTKDATFVVWQWFNGTVRNIDIQSDGKIIVWWDFTEYDWTSANRIIRLNADGTVDTTFQVGNWFDATVRVVKILQNGNIYIWWDFTTYDWISAQKMAILYADGTRYWSFVSSVAAGNVHAVVEQSDGKLVVWWDFTTYSWVSRNRIIRLNADFTLDTWFATWLWFNQTVRGIWLQSDGKLVVVWDFTSYSWVTSNGIIRLNTNWTRDTSFSVWQWFFGVVLNVRATTIQSDGKIIVWWAFTAYDLEVQIWITRLNTDGTRDSWFNSYTFNASPAYAQNVDTLVKMWWKYLVWGSFTRFNGIVVNRMARLNDDFTLDTWFNIWWWFNNRVAKIVLQPDGKLVVWWNFTTYSWVSRNRIIRLNDDFTLDTWFNIWWWFNGGVLDVLLQPDGKILAMWNFTAYSWVSRSRIARLNADGTLDVWFTSPWFNNAVTAFVLQPDGKIIVWWEFSLVGGLNRLRIARLNTNGTVDASYNAMSVSNNWWAPEWPYYPSDMELQPDGKVVVWWRTPINGNSLRLTRLTTTWHADSTFTRLSSTIGWYVGNVNALALESGGKIIFQWPSWIMRVNSDGTIDTGFNMEWANRLFPYKHFFPIGDKEYFVAQLISVWPLVRIYWQELLTYTAPDESFTFKYTTNFQYRNITWRWKLVTMFSPVAEWNRYNAWSSIFYVTKWNTSDTNEVLYTRATAQMRKLFRGTMTIRSELVRTDNGRVARIAKYRWRIAGIQKEYTVAVLRDATSVYVITANADASKKQAMEDLVDVAVRTWTFATP